MKYFYFIHNITLIYLQCIYIMLKCYQKGCDYMATTTMNIRIDSDLKKEIEAIFSELGLTTSAAITIFAKAVVRNEGIPFELTLKPNAETIEAMNDALYGRNLSKAYNNVKELRAALDAED